MKAVWNNIIHVVVRCTVIFFAFCGIPSYAEAALTDTLETEASRPTGSRFTFLYDPGLTMRSGAEDIITLHYGITRTEENLVGTHWFGEENFVGKVGGILGRFTKYALLDVPVDYFSVVLAHEYLGHGARYRELGIENIHYGFDAPPPYGKGGGEATSSLNGNVVSYHEQIGMWLGGLEVQPLINQRLALRWMATRTMHYRDAMLYFWSWQIGFNYIQGTTGSLTTGKSDNDPQAYIRLLNRDNGYFDPASPLFSIKDLKSRVQLDLANPFVFFSLYASLKTYLWDGNSTFDFPTLQLGQIDYLPVLRAGLTPFGLEYHIENYLRYGDVLSLVDLRLGDGTFHNSWGGIGLTLQNVYAKNRFSTDVELNIWTQPELRFGGVPGSAAGGGTGGALSLRGYYDVSSGELPLCGVVELGFKSVGFLEGYAFDASPIIRIGVAIQAR